MPTIPVYGGRRIATAPLQGVRVPTQAPDGAFESGLQQALPAAVNASAQRDELTRQLELKAKLDADELAVNEADRKAADARVDLVQNPQTGAMAKRGLNALGALSDAQEQWAKRMSDIESTLTNDDQKRKFASRERGHYGQLVNQIAAHTSAEVRKADIATTESFLDDGLADVQADPTKAPAAITDARQRLIEFGQRQGWSPEELKAKAADHVSDIHASAIASLVEQKSYDSARQARAYLDANKGEIQGKQRVQAEKLVDAAMLQGEAQKATDEILSGLPVSDGIVARGNIDVTKRPQVKNADGSTSTVRSISIEEDGKTILIPTVIGNKVVSNDQAIAHYKKTGENLGTFKDEAAATRYATSLHESQAAALDGQGDGTVQQGKPPETLMQALEQTKKIEDPKVRAEVARQIRRHFQDVAADERAQRAAAFQTAGQILERTKDLSKIPTAMWMQLSPAERRGLKHDEDQVRHPEKRKTSDMETYMSLLNASVLNEDTRQAFAKVSLAKYRDVLSDADYKEMVRRQAAILGANTRSSTAARKKEVADSTRHPFEWIAKHPRTHPAVAEVIAPAPSGDIKSMFTPKVMRMREPTPQERDGLAKATRDGKAKEYGDYLRSVGVSVP